MPIRNFIHIFAYIFKQRKLNNKKNRKMILKGYTYQPKQTQGGKPSESGMLYSGSEEII